MSNGNKNKHTVLEFYRLFYNEKRFEDSARLLAEGFINHHPGSSGKGRKGMIDDFGRTARLVFPDFHIEPRRLVAEDAFVWVHSLITGLPNGGRAVSVDIWRFERGAIVEHWDVGQTLEPDQDADAMF